MSSSSARGVEVTRPYKTFLATSPLVSDVIRVVIVRFEDGGWISYFRTDPVQTWEKQFAGRTAALHRSGAAGRASVARRPPPHSGAARWTVFGNSGPSPCNRLVPCLN